jgi:OPT family oligopeptide transporter
MPVSVIQAFDNTGAPYDLTAIVTNGTFDLAKYEKYSPMYLPITYAVSYGTIFATFPALLVHTFLWYRKEIYHRVGRTLKDEKDIHSLLMRKYPEVPHWWYIVIGVISFGLGIISIEVLHIGLPIWMFIFSIILGTIFIIPVGIIQAITNEAVFTEVLSEMIAGYIHPGHPVAILIFRTISGSVVTGSLFFTSDLKFGHYMKIPPRLVFIGQIVGSVVALFSTIIAREWALDNIPDICKPHQKSFFTCPNLDTYLNSSILWGGIGPKRFFSPGAM